MRVFAAPARDLSVASPPQSRAPVGPMPLVPSPHAYARRSVQAAVSGVLPPQPETAWGRAAMAAQAELKEIVPESERALAQEIAKAMQPPPLMSRLARIQTSFAELPGAHPDRAAPAMTGPAVPPPIPLPPAPPAPQPSPPAASLPEIDAIADDADAGWSTPPSAEWLGKARRERNRARLRNGAAWIATLAIGGGIVASTMLMLPR